MSHPAEQFVGFAYDEKTADCADFVAHVQRELYGREVQLPNGRPRGNRGRVVMKQTVEAQAIRTETPVDGDLVLMRETGRVNAGHVGLYFWIANEGWVLHSTDRIGESVFHRVRDLPVWGCFIEGFYTWV